MRIKYVGGANSLSIPAFDLVVSAGSPYYETDDEELAAYLVEDSEYGFEYAEDSEPQAEAKTESETEADDNWRAASEPEAEATEE